ncbi:MAG: PDDEXK nuclease domain-containing protein [Candidatus Binatia bacterium]
MASRQSNSIYNRIRQILESSRASVARSVNTTQVVAYWLIGREIVEEEQQGRKRAGYGEALLGDLARRLKADFGSGYSVNNLKFIRQFYFEYPGLMSSRDIGYAVRSQFAIGLLPASKQFRHAARSESWKPSRLHPNLSWTHYRTLLRVDKAEARAFYEIEAIKNHWSARELERQINSLLYERLALSKDKKGLMKLATKGQPVQQPSDIFKDPVVMEFLGLPETPRLVETDLEQALINNLQSFLLELGKGFAFVARQDRLTLDGDHFYIDLVFYHTVLKCYVIIDLKTGKLTHQDLGQLQLYVNYYDRERRTEGDSPTLGLILCADKNDAVVKYTLGLEQEKKIFASRYKLHLPTEAELKAEIRRELRMIQGGEVKA